MREKELVLMVGVGELLDENSRGSRNSPVFIHQLAYETEDRTFVSQRSTF